MLQLSAGAVVGLKALLRVTDHADGISVEGGDAVDIACPEFISLSKSTSTP